MQINAKTGEKYDERQSKDERYSYSITSMLLDDGKSFVWHVDCWLVDSGENHWHKDYYGVDAEAKALAEYNRFD